MDSENKFNQNQRTEEVQHIIDRMPQKFGFRVGMIVAAIFVMLLFFGWIVRYPDVLKGQITVNANTSPLKLVAASSGKLKLQGIRSMSEVEEGQVFAWIENPTSPEKVFRLDSLLEMYHPTIKEAVTIKRMMPEQVSVGELTIKYYTFYNALQEMVNYTEDRYYDKQEEHLRALWSEQKKSIITLERKLQMARKTLSYAKKFYIRDSTLFVSRVISEAELDKSQMQYLNARDAVESAANSWLQSKQAASQTLSKIEELGIQSPEKEKQLKITLISAYNDLRDNIQLWQQRYVFKAPFKGKVQFLKFYNEDQFVQSGEQVFTIVPSDSQVYGQVILPAQGSGKLDKEQEVIVKLDNYPYMEYGSVKGKVSTISLTTNTEKTEKGNLESYLVTVSFPEGLKTNYGRQLEFKHESKGTAEIITKDRRLVQRLFDNLKYVLEK